MAQLSITFGLIATRCSFSMWRFDLMIYGSNIFVLQMKAFQRIRWSRFDNLYFGDCFWYFVFISLLKLEKGVELEKTKKVALTAQIHSRIGQATVALPLSSGPEWKRTCPSVKVKKHFFYKVILLVDQRHECSMFAKCNFPNAVTPSKQSH